MKGNTIKTCADPRQVAADATEIFHNGYACSEAVIYAVDKHFELGMGVDAIAMSSGFPWGLGGGGCLCGAAAGAVRCLGFVFGRREPGDPCCARCWELAEEFYQAMRESCGSTCCRVLMRGLERDDPERKAGCTRAVDFAAAKVTEMLNRERAKCAETVPLLTSAVLRG